MNLQVRLNTTKNNHFRLWVANYRIFISMFRLTFSIIRMDAKEKRNLDHIISIGE